MSIGRLLGICLLLGSVLSHPVRAEAEPGADAEIQYLLNRVATSGCDFVRNGSVHSPEEAADHLRLKYERGSRYAGTAEQFIDRLARQSSWTGKPYTINCGGKTELAGTWLHEALTAYRAGGTAGPDKAANAR